MGSGLLFCVSRYPILSVLLDWGTNLLFSTGYSSGETTPPGFRCDYNRRCCCRSEGSGLPKQLLSEPFFLPIVPPGRFKAFGAYADNYQIILCGCPLATEALQAAGRRNANLGV